MDFCNLNSYFCLKELFHIKSNDYEKDNRLYSRRFYCFIFFL
jgi:hypothetical protein